MWGKSLFLYIVPDGTITYSQLVQLGWNKSFNFYFYFWKRMHKHVFFGGLLKDSNKNAYMCLESPFCFSTPNPLLQQQPVFSFKRVHVYFSFYAPMCVHVCITCIQYPNESFYTLFWNCLFFPTFILYVFILFLYVFILFQGCIISHIAMYLKKHFYTDRYICCSKYYSQK